MKSNININVIPQPPVVIDQDPIVMANRMFM